MDLKFNTSLAEAYHSPSQKARVMTEDWFDRNMYCPVCGAPSLILFKPNKPVADFFCKRCSAQYELKSRKKKTPGIYNTVSGGEYDTMINRISAHDHPHFFFLTYFDNKVLNLVFISSNCITKECVEKRNPLSDTAKRKGWTGCNIHLSSIPENQKVDIIKTNIEMDKNDVMKKTHNVETPCREINRSKGWLVDVMLCVDKLGEEFTIDDVYNFTEELQAKHPRNHHVHDKIRQQLQFLRNKGYIDFTSPGVYRRAGSDSLL